MADLRTAVEGLVIDDLAPAAGIIERRGFELAIRHVLALIPEGAVLVTEEALARAIHLHETDWDRGAPPDCGDCEERAAAILARIREGQG